MTLFGSNILTLEVGTISSKHNRSFVSHSHNGLYALCAERAPTYNGFQDIWDVHSTTVINTKWKRDHVIPLATNILATIFRINHTV
mgnify:FL=1